MLVLLKHRVILDKRLNVPFCPVKFDWGLSPGPSGWQHCANYKHIRDSGATLRLGEHLSTSIFGGGRGGGTRHFFLLFTRAEGAEFRFRLRSHFYFSGRGLYVLGICEMNCTNKDGE